MARTYVVTGSASGIGAATLAMLAADGHRVIGVDRHQAEVVADLSTGAGRAAMIDAVATASDGTVDGVIACAGLSGGQHDPQLIIRFNYFGALASLEGLRHLLARSDTPRAVVVALIAVLLSSIDDRSHGRASKATRKAPSRSWQATRRYTRAAPSWRPSARSPGGSDGWHRPTPGLEPVSLSTRSARVSAPHR